MNKTRILLTGATGYIGSHTWLALLQAGFEVVGVDNFSNSSPEVLNRLRELSGKNPQFEKADVCDAAALAAVIDRHRVGAAIHFAAYKAVGESVRKPLAYYANNLGGLFSLCAGLALHGAKTLVFSSSATVYGKPKQLPISEDSPLGTTNPYGATKLMSENVLRDLQGSDADWRIGLLRYFNPVGAHASGRIGEDPNGIPNNLMPFITQVAIGKRARLQVFGDDYDTADGTGVRDYIHVLDLAEGHVAALHRLLGHPGSFTVNLGTGTGYSVLDMVRAFERASGRAIPYDIVDRRAGDIDACYADPKRARELLHWQAQRDLDAMCADSWRWQQLNPEGFVASGATS